MFQKNIRSFENIHIPLWLIKDTCWMFQWKIFGVCMIVPTLFVSLAIVYITRKSAEVFVNAAISFWIIANAYWMCAEFFHFEEKKEWAVIPFSLGFFSVGIFYFNALKSKKQIKSE